MTDHQNINIFWFRRDLRLRNNNGLYHCLKAGLPVLPVFIFDENILNKLDEDDARVNYIYKSLKEINRELKEYGSSLFVSHGTPLQVVKDIICIYNVKNIFTNSDYEPYARLRDEEISRFLKPKDISFYEFKDHVIFEKSEISKHNNEPYTVFTPYKRKWLEQFLPDRSLKAYPAHEYFTSFLSCSLKFPSLKTIGFESNSLSFPNINYESILNNYSETRNIPSVEGTSKLSVHLRFGTISIREVAAKAVLLKADSWLNQLIWRDFYSMILWHFPSTVEYSFKKQYDNIQWINKEEDFKAWCEGQTGYPIVDAGMRQLNETGWMHNRLRMITASFLCKHLLIDWRWGEAYFARKLLDYDLANNVGGWQWAAGSGNDAAPYFRIFNPELQTKKFDPQLQYIKKWVPEFQDPLKYPNPIVVHKLARERVLREFKRALS